MATVSEGQNSFAGGLASSSTQFLGYTKFGDATKSTNGALQHKDQMAQAPRSSSGQDMERTLSGAPTRIIGQDSSLANSSPGMTAQELIDIESRALIEGVLGPNKDGRVRNPVPSKLKGKTDHKQGNFGVMSMGMSPGKKNESHGRDAAAERDAAARKTSEATQSRAKAAQSDKYIPPKKRGLEAALNDGQPGASRGSPFAVSRDDNRQRARPLAPDETKVEQARLLTLLRTINPVTVVDQICKAVAYFGGIPGAPPPEDGIFPESANTRETGALFIGWLAEIFPDLASRSPEVTKDQTTGGGKNKARASRGSKSSLGNENTGASEAPNSMNGYGFGPAISAPTWGLPPSLAAANAEATANPIPLGATGDGMGHNNVPAPSPSTPVKAKPDDAGNDSTSKRRRGRPKGSRNKGKSDGPTGDENDNHPNDGQNKVGVAIPRGADLPKAGQATAQSSVTPAFPAINSQTNMSKPAQALQYPDHPWQDASGQNLLTQAPVIPIGNELSPEERAVLEAFRHQGPEALNIVPSPAVSAKPAPEAGQKRKRAPAKPKVTAPPAANNYTPDTTSVPNASPIIPPAQSAGLTGDALQWAPAQSTSAIPPPPKRPRQRKPKTPNAAETPVRTQSKAAVANATPPIPPSAIPDSQDTASQQSISQTVQQSVPVSRPPAEGLEAHYERFASFQQQHNGRSNTPTQTLQHQQQHVRQHSRPSSTPLQQNTPQVQQPQVPQQSAQPQSVARDDPKLIPAPSAARPGSAATTYFNQRPQAASTPTYGQQASTTPTYSQQYPSHQPSQLYTAHQASPQMSNSSYRTSSTHTMAQASPQFSQAEISYRTASPHTNISQASPSYAQTNDSFRANNAHSITQPSSAFSQSDTTYRAPSTHTMAQPTPSYSTSRLYTQTQSSNQGPYGGFSDPSYVDLPALDTLGHSTSTGGYGQNLGVGLGGSLARSSASTNNSVYGSSGLGNAYDTSSNDLLRGISGRTTNSSTAYGASSSRLSNAYDTTSNEHDMREQLLRGLGGRR